LCRLKRRNRKMNFTGLDSYASCFTGKITSSPTSWKFSYMKHCFMRVLIQPAAKHQKEITTAMEISPETAPYDKPRWTANIMYGAPGRLAVRVKACSVQLPTSAPRLQWRIYDLQQIYDLRL
jgi:hypothetical protein